MQGFRQLDAVLRRAGAADPLADGDPVPHAGSLVRVTLLLAAGYGLCMGVYGLLRPGEPEYRQAVASAGKVPALFGLTLAVTFPSLYVFGTLLGSRVRAADLLRLVAASLAVLVAVLGAFGPIVAFFSVSTTSYPFILLLNVGVFGVSGLFAARFLHRCLASVRRRAEGPDRGPTLIFYVWMLLFGLVGGQMGWVLRPFVGNPTQPFTWFRPRESSFIEGVWNAARALLGG